AASENSLVIVEGAGGLLVPLAGGVTNADAFARWGLPLVVVARPEVGTINHTLLTLSEARRRGLGVLAVLVMGEPSAFVRQALSDGGTTAVVIVPRIEPLSAGSVVAAAARALSDP